LQHFLLKGLLCDLLAGAHVELPCKNSRCNNRDVGIFLSIRAKKGATSLMHVQAAAWAIYILLLPDDQIYRHVTICQGVFVGGGGPE
jgi:hypothetical protein